MSKKMLIDASHLEETRVVLMNDGRLEEFDYESTFRKPLKGNIYLAKVTRVEPSLQAAFVNYGGNRHGFLPFSEIHPDYFRIPVEDREALMAEQEEELREHDEMEEAAEEEQADNADASDEDASAEDDHEEDEVEELGGDLALSSDEADADVEDADAPEDAVQEDEHLHEDGDVNGNVAPSEGEDGDDAAGNKAEDEGEDGDRGRGRGRRGGRGGRGRGRGRGGRGRNAAHRSKRVESFGGGEMDEEQRFRFNLRRKYKIQEVVKRGQIMLIQVSKEERGNKGAAVTTYLSLPGRYGVLMPNSPRAGGVSRKISNYKDRAKMRDMMKALEVPKGMSVILRTAGVTRTKTEIKRDLDYLMRLWNNIRELTLESTAPSLVYEEADLIKRAVRDHYTRDIDEVHVEGENGFKTAKDFMKMMIPSHAKKVIEYKSKDGVPLFNKHQVEEQIAEIGETTVTLKSGGYLIINPTEALVSVDVNSGRATKERHIEETALKTNLEAAEEVARQLRLRDLGGLVVIDFIDMEDRRNNGKVERKMREALSGDKARIQMGRISSFGLMEMSRQRMSASLGETQFETCPHCAGTGRVRTSDAASILVLRDIEAEGIKGRAAEVIVHVSSDVALYILNNKRQNLASLEERYSFKILIRVDDTLGSSGCRVEVSKPLRGRDQDEERDEESAAEGEEDNRENRRGGRRRGRRGGRRRGQRDDAQGDEAQSEDVSDEQPEETKAEKPSSEDKPKRGRKKKSEDKGEEAKDEKVEEAKEEKPKRGRKKKSEDKVEEVSEEAKEKPAKKSPAKKAKPSNDDEKVEEKPLKKAAAKTKKDDTPKDYETVNETPKAKKKGWWSK